MKTNSRFSYNGHVGHVRTCVLEEGIKGRDKQLHSTDTVGCNYLSSLFIPPFGTQVVIYPIQAPRVSQMLNLLPITPNTQPMGM